MFKFNKLALSVILSTALVGCANINDSYRTAQQDFKQYEEITAQYNIKEDWWTLYQDSQLNKVVEQALLNNKDLAKAAISVNSALYKANLLGADLVPSFSGSTSSSATKNIREGGNSSISHGGSLSVSYTLDLWRRLADAASAGEWTYAATQQDMESTRLSLINSVVTTYYQIAYLNDAITAAQDSVNYYSQINNIMQNRLSQGIADRASTDQAQQSVLSARNTLISYQTERKTAEQTLRNLLNLKPNEALNINYPHILNVKNTEVNLNVPFSTIANRPDVKGYQYRLNSAFKDAKAMQKSWFPTISLGAGLSSEGTKVNNAFNVPLASGTLGISLPFLDWNHVKWNVKISEAAYETAKLNFEQSITSALNDIDTNYFSYTQVKQNFANLQQKYEYDKRITQYYRNRYNAGVSELREWLNAANTEKASQISILNAKYSLIQSENAIYSSMAGYYSPKPSQQ
ncbi:NodT family efflux transporter outer membrane factor (OMF) lipoprotein [Mesocricetibacter intestinalis]|uniref:NodT family efflux transporter outer membrane factor (OMF) lipoprotein n=1 Tax=Mesocricetibacter intestinalis TaxID=1521930 RepID=A0A4R6VE15_9PAST|nr:TolC family protein [Mesocricetibacter intestinalis]TDQ58984.1 NodT family efflux transporter outer membrane factor (OMF) lipoprotein [Mesocricetibacter intestinalis]